MILRNNFCSCVGSSIFRFFVKNLIDYWCNPTLIFLILWITSNGKFFLGLLFSLNGPDSLYLNFVCIKCSSGINLTPTNKKIVNYCIHFLCSQNKISPNNDILLKGFLITNWLNSPLASCSLTNLDVLLIHTAHFDRSIVFALLVFETFAFLLCASVLHFK